MEADLSADEVTGCPSLKKRVGGRGGACPSVRRGKRTRFSRVTSPSGHQPSAASPLHLDGPLSFPWLDWTQSQLESSSGGEDSVTETCSSIGKGSKVSGKHRSRGKGRDEGEGLENVSDAFACHALGVVDSIGIGMACGSEELDRLFFPPGSRQAAGREESIEEPAVRVVWGCELDELDELVSAYPNPNSNPAVLKFKVSENENRNRTSPTSPTSPQCWQDMVNEESQHQHQHQHQYQHESHEGNRGMGSGNPNPNRGMGSGNPNPNPKSGKVSGGNESSDKSSADFSVNEETREIREALILASSPGSFQEALSPEVQDLGVLDVIETPLSPCRLLLLDSGNSITMPEDRLHQSATPDSPAPMEYLGPPTPTSFPSPAYPGAAVRALLEEDRDTFAQLACPSPPASHGCDGFGADRSVVVGGKTGVGQANPN
ncbi:unnamed protein product, partial [Discosporangium mesarthrocarpum]